MPYRVRLKKIPRILPQIQTKSGRKKFFHRNFGLLPENGDLSEDKITFKVETVSQLFTLLTRIKRFYFIKPA